MSGVVCKPSRDGLIDVHVSLATAAVNQETRKPIIYTLPQDSHLVDLACCLLQYNTSMHTSYMLLLLNAMENNTMQIFVFVMCSIGLLANGIFLFLVARIKSIRTPFNIILSNLAVANVSFLIVVFLFTYYVVCAEDGHLHIAFFLLIVSRVASGLFVTVVAIERFLATFNTLKYSAICNNKRRLAKICVGTWIFAAACGGMLRLYISLFMNEDAEGSEKIILIVIVIIFCLLFLIFNFVLYACVFWRLKKRPVASSHVQRRIMIKLAITTFTVFIFDTAYVVIRIMLQHWKFEEINERCKLHIIILAVNAANSTMNPLVYGFLSFNFTKFSVRKLFCGCFSEKRMKTYSSSKDIVRSVKKTVETAV